MKSVEASAEEFLKSLNQHFKSVLKSLEVVLNSAEQFFKSLEVDLKSAEEFLKSLEMTTLYPSKSLEVVLKLS